MNKEVLKRQFNTERPYRCVAQKLISENNSALVYKGRKDNKPIAIKLSRFSHGTRNLGRFYSQTEHLQSLHHPNILPIEDAGHILFSREQKRQEAVPFMTMEYASNGTVRQSSKQEGFTTEKALSHVDQVMEGLIYAHGTTLGDEVLHGDLKPDNFVIARDVTKLIDFKGGFQKGPGGISVKSNAWVIGTFSYMAPEVFCTDGIVASDIYAMGVVAYELVAGKLPILADKPDAQSWYAAHTRAEVSEINKLDENGKVDHIADAIFEPVLQAMSPNPKQRFASMAEFRHELKEAIDRGKYLSDKAITSLS